MNPPSPALADGGPAPKAPRVEGLTASSGDLLAAIHALGHQLSTLSVKVDSLERNAASGGGARPPQPPPYPDTVTAEALSQLASDAGTPPIVVPFLTTLAALIPTVVDEHHHDLIQQCYTHSLQLRQAPPTPTSHFPPASPANGDPLPYPALSPPGLVEVNCF